MVWVDDRAATWRPGRVKAPKLALVDRDFAVILVWGAGIALVVFLIVRILDWIGLVGALSFIL
jgi:hypothetical protein